MSSNSTKTIDITVNCVCSTVAVCEVINHPDVRCSTPGRDHATGKTGSSEGGAVPEKYYVVANNDHVRVKQILIFETSSADKRNKTRKYEILCYKFVDYSIRVLYECSIRIYLHNDLYYF